MPHFAARRRAFMRIARPVSPRAPTASYPDWPASSPAERRRNRPCGFPPVPRYQLQVVRRMTVAHPAARCNPAPTKTKRIIRIRVMLMVRTVCSATVHEYFSARRLIRCSRRLGDTAEHAHEGADVQRVRHADRCRTARATNARIAAARADAVEERKTGESTQR